MIRQSSGSVVNPASDPHVNGEYLRKNPTWHVEYSPAKAGTILHLLARNKLEPRLICEVGCGAGEVLRQLQLKLPSDRRFWGYDVSPDAIRLAWGRENDGLRFLLADFIAVDTPCFDLLLVLEVVDHIEDYLGFLRRLKNRAEWKVFSFTLDISAQSALRRGAFATARRQFDHLHHFNKEIALATLRHAGYEVVDFSYGPNHAGTTAARLAKPLRALSFALNPDLSVRLFGGHSLVVLAR
ncbi:MAG TPA: methyltransferase domain-containing protein [Bryobacteraceae bacterium]|nr:methyltransferase domain-containing protein [Bryobacteraceae bacterium]